MCIKTNMNVWILQVQYGLVNPGIESSGNTKAILETHCHSWAHRKSGGEIDFQVLRQVFIVH